MDSFSKNETSSASFKVRALTDFGLIAMNIRGNSSSYCSFQGNVYFQVRSFSCDFMTALSIEKGVREHTLKPGEADVGVQH